MTLIELMAALALVGMLLLGMRMVLDQLGDAGERIALAARSGDARGNGDRVLRLILRRAIAGADSTHRFVGEPTTAEFDSSCDTYGGWPEHCRVALHLVYADDSTVVQADSLGGPSLRLAALLGRAEFRYYDPSRTDDNWLASWGRSIAVPSAVSIVSAVDTIIVRTGGSL